MKTMFLMLAKRFVFVYDSCSTFHLENIPETSTFLSILLVTYSIFSVKKKNANTLE